VGLCPGGSNVTQETANSVLKSKSIVNDIPNPTPQLWDALMEGEDLLERWTSFKYNVDIKGTFLKHLNLFVCGDGVV
jgi:hypothetical protein